MNQPSRSLLTLARGMFSLTVGVPLFGVKMEEVWRDITGYEGYYQVSNMGNVKRIAKGSGALLGRNRKFGITGAGYYTVALSKNNKAKSHDVHRLVAETFVGGRSLECNEVNHKNRNKLDNRQSNLEWVSHSQNQYHMHKHNPNQIRGNRVKASKLDEETVRYIKSCGLGTMLLARKYNVAKGTITAIRKGRTWKHV